MASVSHHSLPGQLKLRNASVAVVGAGGLGCPALQYLAAVGIGCNYAYLFSFFLGDAETTISGKLGIIDHDVVDLPNLQRQVLHTESRINMAKALSAEIALKEYVQFLITLFST